MNALKDDPRFRFIFAGGGSRRAQLESQCPNAEFRPYCNRTTLSASLAEGHLGLVTQLPQTCGSLVPSKTYGIMAAGRPILYIGPREATPARIIEKYNCGWRITPGDTEGLIKLLNHLECHRHELVNAGAQAREAFEQNYDRPQGVARIAKILGLDSESPTTDHQTRNRAARVSKRSPHPPPITKPITDHPNP